MNRTTFLNLFIFLLIYIVNPYFSAAQTIYTFTGNGNWSDITNWNNNKIPPSILPNGSQIIINPIDNGKCILDVLQTISPNAQLTVISGKNFVLLGNVKIKYDSTNSSNIDTAFIDPRDGQIYTYIRIGTQIWMAQNLNYAVAGSVCYDSSLDYCAIYGRLYDWYTALTVAPLGWHLPSDSEWAVLTSFIGGSDSGGVGGELKEVGTTHWHIPNTGANNQRGFTGLPGGSYYLGTSFNMGLYGQWWSTGVSNDPTQTAVFVLDYNDIGSNIFYTSKYTYQSVRCIKN